MSRNPIQLVACTIRPESNLRNLSLQQLSFPNEWFEVLQALQAERSERLNQPNSIPIRSLNAILQALMPSLLAVPNAARKQKDGSSEEEADSRQQERASWLLSRQPIPIDRLWYIIQAWLQETYSECRSFLEAEALLSQEDLSWYPATIVLSQKICENGTIDVPKLAFKVIPAIIADLLVERHASLPIGGSKRALVHVPSEEGAELMTWPPAYFIDPDDQDQIPYGYSYTVHITLQTHVGQAEPRIHFHYGVRRWHSKSCIEGSKLFLKRRTTVYFRPAHLWYSHSHTENTTSFTTATLEAVKENDELRLPLWANLLPNIARRVNVPIPAADEITRNPLAWLAGVNGVEAGIVCASSARHPVGVGIGPDLCETITSELMAILSSDLVLCPPCKPLPPPHKGKKHPLMQDLRDLSVQERLAALEKSVGSQITIEVRWQTEEVRDMLVDRILALLTLPRPPLIPSKTEGKNLTNKSILGDDEDENEDEDGEEMPSSNDEEHMQYSNGKPRQPRKRAPEPDPSTAPESQTLSLPGGGQLFIVTIPLEGLGSPLPPPDKQAKQTIHTHTNERARKIRDEVAPARMRTLTLIELPNYRAPELRKQFHQRDPKRALRLGMALVGRVTQFITSDPKKRRHRCEMAVRDGLRQLGYLPSPIGFVLPHLTIPDPLLVVGIWFIRLTRRRSALGVHLPVMVLMDTTQYQVQVWLPHDGRFRPYAQALLDLVHLNPEQVRKRRREEALSQVRQFLLRDLAKQGIKDVVVFTVAQNARGTWHGLFNTEVLFDGLRFERRERPLPTTTLPVQLRLIRLRTSLRGETPEWYVPASLPVTTAQGLWVEHDANEKNRLFYSIAGKPHTAPKKYIGKQHKPRENYRLSSIVETLPFILPAGENSHLWAVTVDQWRKMGYLTNDMTLLPLPLELAQKLGEYAAVIGPWVFPDEWNEEDEEEEEEEDKDNT